MWRAFLILAFVACETSTGQGTIDAGTDGKPFDPCGFVQLPPADQACTHTCGNNTIDTCWITEIDPQTHCPMSFAVTETCDGAAHRCADDGYFGGTETCDSCQTNTSNCETCAPDDLSCVTLPIVDELFGIATNSTQIAFASSYAVTLYAATTLTRQAQATSASPLEAIVGVPGGFLVASLNPPYVQLVTPQGMFAPGFPIDSSFNLPTLVYAPNSGRVLVAWSQDTGNDTWMIRGQILSATGAAQVSSFTIFTGNPSISATTDGTAFFVGSQGTLARVLADGTVTSVTGAASSESTTRVFWGGSTGWMLIGLNGNTTVTRFDASGAFFGSSFAIAAPDEIIADGDALVALQFAPTSASAYRVQLVRIDANGPGTPIDIGATEVSLRGFVRRSGSALIAVWQRYVSQKLARVTPL